MHPQPFCTRGHSLGPVIFLMPPAAVPICRTAAHFGAATTGPETRLMAAVELRTRSRATPRIWSRLWLAVGVAFVLFAVVLSTGAGGSQVSKAVSNFGL